MSIPPADPENPTQSGYPKYSVFVSYSSKDNATGWVKQLVEALRKEARQVLDDGFEACDPVELFFDRDNLRLREEWRTQLAWAVRDSEVLLVCVSNPYFESDPCLWEFQEHASKPRGPDNQVGLVPVLLEETRDDQPDEEHQRWHTRVYQMHCHNMQDVFTRDAITTLTGMEAKIRALGDELYRQKRERRRWDATAGNLGRGTSRFVGRERELTQLSEMLASSSTVGVVTAIHGIDGIGKTELITHYGNQHRGHYTAGIWQIPSEGAREMLPLLARLARELPDFQLPEEARNNPEIAGRCVLAELRQRGRNQGHMLLVLDNVDEPALLTDPQLGMLPEDRNLHVAATTHLDLENFLGSTRLKQIHLQGLSPEETINLLQAFQPNHDSSHHLNFYNEDDRAATPELVKLLDGFTLAIEQAGVYLSTHRHITIRKYINHLHAQGLSTIEETSEEDKKARIMHREKLLSAILNQSLTDLEGAPRGSLQVLQLAAAMPLHVIPWPWVEKLTQVITPEVFQPSTGYLKGRWLQICRALEGRDLITEGRYMGITGQMHHLIAKHLRAHGNQEISLLDEFITRHAHELGADFTKEPEPWEVDTLMDALPQVLARNPIVLERVSNFIRKVAFSYLADTRIVVMLQDLTRQLAGTKTRTNYLAHILLGDSLQDTETSKALEKYKKSLKITRKLVESKPTNLQFRSDLIASLNRITGMLCDINPMQALKYYQETIEAQRDLSQDLPGNIQALRNLTTSLNNFADILRDIDPKQAVEYYKEAIEITCAIAKNLPDNLRTLRDLTNFLKNLAEMLYDIDLTQALEFHSRAVEAQRNLAQKLPDNIQVLRDLANFLNNFADILRDIKSANFLKYYKEAIVIQRGLAERLPRNFQFLQDLGVSAARLALLLPTDDPERNPLQREAATNLRGALAIQPEHQKLGPMSYQAALDYAYCDPGDRDEWLAYAAELAERFRF